MGLGGVKEDRTTESGRGPEFEEGPDGRGGSVVSEVGQDHQCREGVDLVPSYLDRNSSSRRPGYIRRTGSGSLPTRDRFKCVVVRCPVQRTEGRTSRTRNKTLQHFRQQLGGRTVHRPNQHLTRLKGPTRQ